MNKSIKVNLKGANVQCVGKYNRETNKLTISSGSVIERKFLQTLNITLSARLKLKSIAQSRKIATY